MTTPIEVISKSIKKSRTLKAGTIYVVDAEVHVACGVTLKVETVSRF